LAIDYLDTVKDRLTTADIPFIGEIAVKKRNAL
jgi:hypothetical protein